MKTTRLWTLVDASREALRTEAAVAAASDWPASGAGASSTSGFIALALSSFGTPAEYLAPARL